MTAVTTELVNTNVKISWTSPSSNGSPITEYKILILQNDGVTYTEQTSFCSGADATIISNMYCFVPLSVLRLSPYSLTYNSLVVAVA